MNNEKEINRLLEQGQSYFGRDEKIYIFKCKKCNKMDPVPSFIVNEHMGFLNFFNKKDSPKMDCPFCGGTSIPIITSE